ncbi:MAG: type VI secretion system protein ImpH [Pseudoalteromonas tetraodonis]|jgi:type VI secretion system protein ImpH|uniref:Type VI secretion protein n=4 Tax=Pseudoalteromonas TaxID=53246 RepID=A0AA37S494_9GAMM|nr:MULTISPECIES: type VI secretion system baseplate subunit TssG [Pseudoalteromonas]PHQ91719.1 MAG: type VI secretion system baseplate subunit TssG [Pseudoalteromonas sp.]ALQ56518.1 type VI secretion protein [Pseudoalteromonas issachenkonii]KGK02044.1 type VI secretion protein, VC_A0111 family [Pseudoalteromonas sp. ND6B]MDN3435802.1 type VI secretion system baseplate subunit TssG [Pseudoalteromonas sp. APC 3356]GEN38006.1 type VI secretion protein [Pseudoalteromonas tetraodonis GFC]|tara:strand:+ start:604 stop:1593 length:990 start_codon:yes stop_codon:yes gene_type:complete
MIQHIISQASQVDFYKAVFIIENQLKKHGLEYRYVGYDSSPKQELIKFTATQKFGYPGNAITKLEQASFEDGLHKVNMQISFMGLTGCSGALPQFYSELVMQRLRYKDTTMRDFYDMFNHRLVSLYYRAWKKYKPSLNHVNKDKNKDPYTQILGLLSGGYNDHQLHFSGLYSRKIRNAFDLKSVLSSYLGCDVVIKQMVGKWHDLKPQEQTCLASERLYEGQHARLGVDTVIGKKIWDISSNIEIHISTTDIDKAKSLLPKGKLFELATKIVKDYAGNAISFRLIIESDFQQLDAVQLSKRECQLGANSFLMASKNTPKFNPIKLSFKG